MKVSSRRFLESALAIQTDRWDVLKVYEWMEGVRDQSRLRIEEKHICELDSWYVDKSLGSIRHSSGGFFQIAGLRVVTDFGLVCQWDQPIIKQREIGLLGCICKEIDGVLHFLIQAKVEPGNINEVQLSPTVQATKSNFSKLHKGADTKYLEYFTERSEKIVHVDQLQSEQGARFLGKRNRNTVIEIFDTPPPDENFMWLTLGQIKLLMRRDNLVNMDLRSVIGTICFDSLRESDFEDLVSQSDATYLRSIMGLRDQIYDMNDHISWLTQLKFDYLLLTKETSLFDLSSWHFKNGLIEHEDSLYFRVKGLGVELTGREVKCWDQPIVEPVTRGVVGFLVKRVNGVLLLLVQAKLEAGNFDIFELAPTVQCITGSYAETSANVPFLEYMLSADSSQISYDSFQSEEGGRFFKEDNRNLVVEVPPRFADDPPRHFRWMTIAQLNCFMRLNNYVNVQARTLLSTFQAVRA